MTGETDLQKLLKEMKPKLNEGEFVYCSVNSRSRAAELNPLCFFQEAEGVTVILRREDADKAGISYPIICAWITLTVHSALEAVGLTAAVSHALTDANISCNVVAAFYHDHIFVPIKDARQAMNVLWTLTGASHEQ